MEVDVEDADAADADADDAEAADADAADADADDADADDSDVDDPGSMGTVGTTMGSKADVTYWIGAAAGPPAAACARGMSQTANVTSFT